MVIGESGGSAITRRGTRGELGGPSAANSEAQGSGESCRRIEPVAGLGPGDRAIFPGQAIGVSLVKLSSRGLVPRCSLEVLTSAPPQAAQGEAGCAGSAGVLVEAQSPNASSSSAQGDGEEAAGNRGDELVERKARGGGSSSDLVGDGVLRSVKSTSVVVHGEPHGSSMLDGSNSHVVRGAPPL
jgi:hypothetical protein